MVEDLKKAGAVKVKEIPAPVQMTVLETVEEGFVKQIKEVRWHQNGNGLLITAVADPYSEKLVGDFARVQRAVALSGDRTTLRVVPSGLAQALSADDYIIQLAPSEVAKPL